MKIVFIYTFFLLSIALQINIALFGISAPIYIAVAASASSILTYPVFALTTIIMSFIWDLISCGKDYSATLASIPFIVSMIFYENWRQSRRIDPVMKITFIALPFSLFNLLFTAQVMYLYSPPLLITIFSLPLSVILCVLFFVCTETAKRILYLKESERIIFG